ncbi:unnamed protein product [Tetraodon nigroviridis]|uniref:(spotted green pufferfish) hypothetical protein n=1 Tax=Tetraodon nigroviridis TaxID=99883 RepID=Q4S7V2_TETNG|nr:unnamed protein product [Tetraodon nigroviridis]
MGGEVCVSNGPTASMSPSTLASRKFANVTVTTSFVFERGNERGEKKIQGEKETEEIPQKEMPVAATGQPTTQEPRVCLRLPSTPEPVPKGADLFDEAGAAVRIEYGGAEGGRGLGGFTQPGSISGTPPQSPAASTSFLFHPLHSHQMAVEPPRTRSRSRSGYYQQYGSGNGNGITSTGLMGSNHHPNQQQHAHFQQQQQQIAAGCAPLGASSSHPENQPGSNASASIRRFSAAPEALPVPAAGKRPPAGLRSALCMYGSVIHRCKTHTHTHTHTHTSTSTLVYIQVVCEHFLSLNSGVFTWVFVR